MSEIETREGVDLLPCPFCGGNVMLERYIDYNSGLRENGWQVSDVECNACEIRQIGHTSAAAIAAWNTRTPAQTQTFKDGFAAGLEAGRASMQEAIAAMLDEERNSYAGNLADRLRHGPRCGDEA